MNSLRGKIRAEVLNSSTLSLPLVSPVDLATSHYTLLSLRSNLRCHVPILFHGFKYIINRGKHFRKLNVMIHMSDFIRGGESAIVKIVFSKRVQSCLKWNELSMEIIKSIFLFSFLGT